MKLLLNGILKTVIFIRTSWQVSPTPFEFPCCFVNLTEATMTYGHPTFNVWILPISPLFKLSISEDENVHYHVGIVNRLCTSFRFGSDISFSLLVVDLLAMLRLNSDSVPHGQEVSSQIRICCGLLIASVHSI
ncbi:unnamed protein product [Hymenolepis diminuta]|uniref:Uncharacterized protein n=1 Tax=Hymenolepis diminuta TaxID=6216 RepID=A0A564YS17_HYMDI|nr:unnamed protein product [Hymenolepis diminuta]